MFKKENNPNQHIDWQMLLGDIEMKIVMKIRELKISADAKPLVSISACTSGTN